MSTTHTQFRLFSPNEWDDEDLHSAQQMLIHLIHVRDELRQVQEQGAKLQRSLREVQHEASKVYLAEIEAKLSEEQISQKLSQCITEISLLRALIASVSAGTEATKIFSVDE